MFLPLIKKEFRSFTRSPLGWVLFSYTMIMEGICLSTAMKSLADTPIAENLVFVTFHTPNFWFFFLFLFPLITMRSFAEEERSGTLETLLTTPLETYHLVWSKFLARVLFYALLWLPGIGVFLTFGWITDLPMPFMKEILFSTHLFLFILGVYFIALGNFASCLTSNQIIAGIITVGFLIIQYFLGFVTVIWGSHFVAAEFFNLFSAQAHLTNACRGILDTAPLILYLLLTIFTLILTHHAVNYRRWKR